MTEPTRTRRAFFRLLAGSEAPAPVRFSLRAFYAARRETGTTSTDALPKFERAESSEFDTTLVGTPELKGNRA